MKWKGEGEGEMEGLDGGEIDDEFLMGWLILIVSNLCEI